MASKRYSTPASTMGLVAHRYSPGDGHTYTWDGGEYATVYRIHTAPEGDRGTLGNFPGRLTLVPTGDHVYMGDCPRTASAFADRVQAWKTGRVTPNGPDWPVS